MIKNGHIKSLRLSVLSAKLNSEAAALQDKIVKPKQLKREQAENYLKNFPEEERKTILEILMKENGDLISKKRHPDDELNENWRDGPNLSRPGKEGISRTRINESTPSSSYFCPVNYYSNDFIPSGKSVNLSI